MATEHRTFVSGAVEATEALAELVGGELGPGCVVALEGELGAGKTAFVRGLARGLGVTDPVTSPTFTLMHELGGGRFLLHHFDAWMEGREVLFLEGGGAEYLGGDGVAVVEWADRVREWLPRPRLEGVLAHLGPERRRITLTLVDDPGGGNGPLADLLARILALPVAISGLREVSEGEENDPSH